MSSPHAYTLWSGGVLLDRVDSFYLSLRDWRQAKSILLRLEVNLLGATFGLVLTDARHFPPPFRIDNLSQVPVTCHQTGVQDENLKIVVKARQSLPFAWDEPTLAPYLTCTAPGGA